jgi:hypothetical protein
LTRRATAINASTITVVGDMGLLFD